MLLWKSEQASAGLLQEGTGPTWEPHNHVRPWRLCKSLPFHEPLASGTKKHVPNYQFSCRSESASQRILAVLTFQLLPLLQCDARVCSKKYHLLETWQHWTLDKDFNQICRGQGHTNQQCSNAAITWFVQWQRNKHQELSRLNDGIKWLSLSTLSTWDLIFPHLLSSTFELCKLCPIARNLAPPLLYHGKAATHPPCGRAKKSGASGVLLITRTGQVRRR